MARSRPPGDPPARAILWGVFARRAAQWWFGAALAVLVIAVAGFLIKGANTTTRPKVDTNGARPSRVAGFNQIGFQVRAPGGASTRHCALLALTTAQQERGLMNRADLAGYDGMIFQFMDPSTAQFYMKDTLISLSIAWFDQSGRFLSAADMAPCPAATVSCPLYHATAPYTVALEVPEGHLGQLGVDAGSTLTVGGPC